MKAPHTAGSRLVLLAGLISVALFLCLVARFWHPTYGFTRFLQLDASNDDLKISAFNELPVYVYRDTGGYDGFYYAQIAHDPSLSAPELKPATDNLAYRGRRILAPLLAWLLAGGQRGLIVHVYSLLNVAAWLGLAAIVWRLLEVRDVRGWIGWAGVLFSAGALASVRLALTDLIALVVIASAMLAAERGHSRWSTGLVAAAALARETSLLAVVGLLRPPWRSGQNLLRFICVAAPFALWLGYISWRLGGSGSGWGNFALPFVGIIEKWRGSVDAVLHGNPDHVALSWTTLLATAALTVQLAFIFTRWQPTQSWWRIGVVYGAILLWVGSAVWEDHPGAATRVALPLTLAFNVLAVRARVSFAWLIPGNLAVAAGILMFLTVPTDASELAAGRTDGTAAIARIDGGWFGVERTRKHVWSWNRGHGVIEIQTWPAHTGSLRLRGQTRSLAPAAVTIVQDDAVVWRGISHERREDFTAIIRVINGRARVVFATDSPGVLEDATTGARRLTFAVYDLRFEMPEKQP